MSKEINGQIYKDMPVGKMNVNGKEIQGSKIKSDDVTDGVMLVTIISKDDENKE
ncbi:hypothetical protein KPL40_05125 [Clostridium gasigenes]|uniref:hypothetical protein n=1 Tax=Clostridium gasigenes TaxID=94869 RepID=UPI001C0ADDBE|nr:hypothetical protein [Clostridium gasigenes]MBU3131827.1 hypothetical protein [Clostridium gasigenes]